MDNNNKVVVLALKVAVADWVNDSESSGLEGYEGSEDYAVAFMDNYYDNDTTLGDRVDAVVARTNEILQDLEHPAQTFTQLMAAAGVDGWEIHRSKEVSGIWLTDTHGSGLDYALGNEVYERVLREIAPLARVAEVSDYDWGNKTLTVKINYEDDRDDETLREDLQMAINECETMVAVSIRESLEQEGWDNMGYDTISEALDAYLEATNTVWRDGEPVKVSTNDLLWAVGSDDNNDEAVKEVEQWMIVKILAGEIAAK